MPNKKTIENSPLSRALVLETGQARKIDEEARTVEVAFSSEAEVMRWFGREVLDHGSDSVRLGRLQSGGPVLMDHNRSDQVGVVESVRIDSDRKGRALLRFGRSQRADEVFNDVVDDIRRNISVHYIIHKYERTKGEEGAPDLIRVIDWEPTEISVVSVPADYEGAGVGRSDDINAFDEDRNMPEEINLNEETRETPQPAASEQRSEVALASHSQPAPAISVEQVRADERARVSAINSAAADAPWDLSDLARDAINAGQSIEQFRAAAFEFARSQPSPAAAAPGAEMLQRENQDYSLVRAINAQLSGDWSDAGYEREVSQELGRSGGVVGGGLMVPMSIFSGERASDTSNAAGLIGTNHMAGQFIDALRANTLLGKLGARFLPGLNGNVSIPKKTASATFGWLAQAAGATESDVTVGNVSLSGKHVGGVVNMTFELMRQSSPAIEQLVRQDMLEGMALAIDAAGFNGTGAANQPTGILNTVGVQTITLADAAGKIPTFAEIVQMEGLLDEANALMGSLAYAFRPTIHSSLKVAKKDAGSGEFVIHQGEANGYKAHSSTQLPAAASLFGNFNDVMVGLWGMVELIPERDSETGGLKIGCHQMADVAVRNAQSFVKGV